VLLAGGIPARKRSLSFRTWWGRVLVSRGVSHASSYLIYWIADFIPVKCEDHPIKRQLCGESYSKKPAGMR
jgi:hypothetical protein